MQRRASRRWVCNVQIDVSGFAATTGGALEHLARRRHKAVHREVAEAPVGALGLGERRRKRTELQLGDEPEREELVERRSKLDAEGFGVVRVPKQRERIFGLLTRL